MKELEGYTVNFVYDREAFVMADETRLSQVIYNLVNNAIDFTGSDKTVTINQTVSENTVRIEVSDSGEGIPPHMQQHIWQRYYKSDTKRNRMRVGTGLGLSIVKEALLRHNARFGVESSSTGSTFWFELDLAQ
jgi:signal transduction histidine kinase